MARNGYPCWGLPTGEVFAIGPVSTGFATLSPVAVDGRGADGPPGGPPGVPPGPVALAGAQRGMVRAPTKPSAIRLLRTFRRGGRRAGKNVTSLRERLRGRSARAGGVSEAETNFQESRKIVLINTDFMFESQKFVSTWTKQR
ncbi:hypothetical protein Mame01_41060 [Microbispora amethystogenes]|nr:hypothetical protein Mame01_41060 [Microbispora amethystogenes]